MCVCVCECIFVFFIFHYVDIVHSAKFLPIIIMYCKYLFTYVYNCAKVRVTDPLFLMKTNVVYVFLWLSQ